MTTDNERIANLAAYGIATANISNRLLDEEWTTRDQIRQAEEALKPYIGGEEHSRFTGFVERVVRRIRQVDELKSHYDRDGLAGLLQYFNINYEGASPIFDAKFYPHTAVLYAEDLGTLVEHNISFVQRFGGGNLGTLSGMDFPDEAVKPETVDDYMGLDNFLADATKPKPLDTVIVVDQNRPWSTGALMLDMFMLTTPRKELDDVVENTVAEAKYIFIAALSSRLMADHGYMKTETPRDLKDAGDSIDEHMRHWVDFNLVGRFFSWMSNYRGREARFKRLQEYGAPKLILDHAQRSRGRAFRMHQELPSKLLEVREEYERVLEHSVLRYASGPIAGSLNMSSAKNVLGEMGYYLRILDFDRVTTTLTPLVGFIYGSQPGNQLVQEMGKAVLSIK